MYFPTHLHTIPNPMTRHASRGAVFTSRAQCSLIKRKHVTCWNDTSNSGHKSSVFSEGSVCENRDSRSPQCYNILEFPCTGPAVMGSAFSYVAQSARITTVVSNRACDKRCVTCLATLTVPSRVEECQGVKLFGDLRPSDVLEIEMLLADDFDVVGL